jgi:hypothetical protein
MMMKNTAIWHIRRTFFFKQPEKKPRGIYYKRSRSTFWNKLWKTRPADVITVAQKQGFPERYGYFDQMDKHELLKVE